MGFILTGIDFEIFDGGLINDERLFVVLCISIFRDVLICFSGETIFFADIKSLKLKRRKRDALDLAPTLKFIIKNVIKSTRTVSKGQSQP